MVIVLLSKILQGTLSTPVLQLHTSHVFGNYGSNFLKFNQSLGICGITSTCIIDFCIHITKLGECKF